MRRIPTIEGASPRPVLDASAVLAYLQREPGYERVRVALEAGASISTVNLAEVYARAAASGVDIHGVAVRLQALGLAAEPFDESDARATAALYPRTRNLRLSLADRACLTLADRLGSPVLTADHAWVRANLGVEVQLIR